MTNTLASISGGLLTVFIIMIVLFIMKMAQFKKYPNTKPGRIKEAKKKQNQTE